MVDQSGCYRGEDGVALAQRTLELLQHHKVPTSPANYELWISHVANVNPDLSRELQTRIDNGQIFDDAANEALHERFCSNTRLTAEMMQASETFARELSDVVSNLRDAGAQTGAYANALENAVTNIEGGMEATDVSSLLASLAAATRAVIENNRQLSERMETSSRQVDTLQSALQVVKAEALTDGLTGLANRRSFDEVLRKATEEFDAPCLLMCDIDHFKRLNDTWGHLIGDQVIRFIAATLRQYAPEGATVARYGGEEFAIIFPSSDANRALSAASSIHQAVRSRQLTRRSTNEVIGAVTISIGIAQHRNGERAQDLIERADACLYASKRGGRDRITTDESPTRATAA